MTHAELLEWQEYYDLEPFPADRQEYQLAVISQILAASVGADKKTEDFLISHKKKVKPKDNKRLEENIKKIFGVK
ncbi:phage tail assembly protein T [Arcobacter arenosus]|uniref:Minor tail T domain-containing protein n=1 Tax=Arcobacter arenosus TaxID=2576037 RepID=A0A5R8Y4P6_9BACT|nr:hypothetical protein [Arcobacter arenosus]TLP41036.1 hypothetical protein FDK22_03180 [Arcobacter arenosus]